MPLTTIYKPQNIGGPHVGDVDDEGYVLDLADFKDLDESFAEELVSRISIACANNVTVTGAVEAAAGNPTSLVCDGEECSSAGETSFFFQRWMQYFFESCRRTSCSTHTSAWFPLGVV